jgi:hypothetical protein
MEVTQAFGDGHGVLRRMGMVMASCVGWVERSDTHLPIRAELFVWPTEVKSLREIGSGRFDEMGVASLDPSYGS